MGKLPFTGPGQLDPTFWPGHHLSTFQAMPGAGGKEETVQVLGPSGARCRGNAEFFFSG